MLKFTSKVALAVFAAAALTTSANAHPKLKSSVPAAEGAVSGAPSEIKLNFSEGVISKFCKVELMDQAGEKIILGNVATNPKDQKQLIVPLKAPLQAGTYKVVWHAVSVDTHRIDGTYSFKLRP